MSNKTLAYIFPAVDLQSSGVNFRSMTISDIKGSVTESMKARGFNEVVFFVDESSGDSDASRSASKRVAFDMMLEQLGKGTSVIMWSWQCLINRGRLEWASFDVLDALRKIHEHGCSVYFVHEDITTHTAAGRLILSQSVNTAQYHYDFTIEKAKEHSSASCCSSNVKAISAVEIVARSGTGC